MNDTINVRSNSNDPDFINPQPSTSALPVTTSEQNYSPINVNPNNEFVDTSMNTTFPDQSSVAASSFPARKTIKESPAHEIDTGINIDEYIIEEFSEPFEPSSTVPITVGDKTFNFTNCSNFSITIHK